jgi:ankyrin repeat protein
MRKVSLRMRSFRKKILACLAASLCLSASCAEPPATKPSPEAAKRFLKLRGYEFNDKSFFAAVASNDIAAVNGFLSAGTDPNVRSENNNETALIYAASHGQPELIDVMLQNGADVNAKDLQNYTALLRALQKDQDEIVEKIIAQPKVDLNAQGNGKAATVLMYYVQHGDENKVRALLQRGANPKLTDADGDTALHLAAQSRTAVNLVRLLLNSGADPNAKNNLGGTPLMWAAVYGNDDAARLLLEKGADAAIKDNQGVTASQWATKNHYDELAKFLADAEKKR